MPTNDPHLPNQLWHAKFTIMTGAVRKVLLNVVLLTYSTPVDAELWLYTIKFKQHTSITSN